MEGEGFDSLLEEDDLGEERFRVARLERALTVMHGQLLVRRHPHQKRRLPSPPPGSLLTPLRFALGSARGQLNLAQEWRRILDTNSSATLMDFPEALRATHVHMCGALRSLRGPPWRAHALTAAFTQSSACDDALPPAWGAVGFMLGWLANLPSLRLCCSDRRAGKRVGDSGRGSPLDEHLSAKDA